MFDGWVRIGNVEIVLAQSEELRRFVERKVLVGGLQKERTKEQWESTLGEDWFKVYLEGVESEIGDPMQWADVKEVFTMMSGELIMSLLD